MANINEILARLPKGSKADKKKVDLEMELEALKKKAAYTAEPISTKIGRDALQRSRDTLKPAKQEAVIPSQPEPTNAWHELIGFQGKTRAGTPASATPLDEQLGRTVSRVKGFMNEPEAELKRMVYQYLPAPGDSPEEQERKLNDLAMGFAGTTTGKVGNVKVKSTVKDPDRMAFPGIYQRPDVIAAEAASRVAEESPNLQKVFGVTREDLFQMGKGRQGNLPGNLPGAAAKPKGSAAAARVMGSKNVQRIIDTMAEAEKHPKLVQGMDPWYVMDPVYQRMEQLLGKEKAIEEYRKLNTLMGMASPGSEVLTEIPRGTAAYYLQNKGRFPEFMEHAGKPAGARGAGFPADILNVPGHAYHKTAQALPMQQFLESGEMQMSSPKVPMYIEASGVPQTGFQTRTPVGDAHWSRAVGLADTRGAATRKGQPIIPGASVTNPEMSLLGPWWREEVAAPMGLESVPAQARAWGTFSGQTGVTTPIGAPKIELLADKIAETAHRLGVPIDKARDLVLMGETYAGKKNGGAIHMAEGGVPEKRDVSQLFPLKVPADNAELKPQPKYPLLEKASQGVQSLHDFVSAPFGYENPVGEMASSLLGVPAVAKTLGNIAYDMPLTSGSGMTTNLRPETAEAAMAVAPLVGPAVKTGAKVGKALAPTAAEMALDIASKYGVDPRMNIIKPKGGNWLNNSSEFVPRRVKNDTVVWTPEEAERLGYRADHPSLQRDLAVGQWIDKKLHPYIKNEMGTEADQIRLGIERRAAEAEKLKETNQARLAKMEADIAKAKAAGKNTTLSEGDLEKAREKFADEEYIASQGLYHRTIPEGGWAIDNPSKGFEEGLSRKREMSGVPSEPLATHPAARSWERTVDAEVMPSKVKSHLMDEDRVERNPWLTKLNPDEVVYNLDSFSDSAFEFRHMIDELKEAMNPESVLPKHLKIAPKDLEKMTVDDVSALSGKISAWRNVQKTKSDLQIANNPATHTFKEYPSENNPKGVSWRQIKKPEGYSEEEAEKFVREATKYEGDIMRHCVGGAGHCEPLLNGDVEIYTLRDAKGEPHVTIEVEPAKHPYEIDLTKVDKDTKYKYQQYVREWRQRNPTVEELTDQDVYAALREAGVPPQRQPKILEIKGKNNRKPSPEYIPFVQDFVKSGNFKYVGDIHHTDLRTSKDVLGLGVLAELQRRGVEVPNFMDFEDAAHFQELFKPGSLDMLGGKEGYRKQWNAGIQNNAEGGAVRMADGGAVGSWEQMVQSSYNTNPDMKDGGSFVQAPAFAKGGAVSNAWINLIEGAQNA